MHRLQQRKLPGSRISDALLESFGESYEKSANEYKEAQKTTKTSEYLESLGIDPKMAKEAARNPMIMKSILENKMLEDRASKIMGSDDTSRILGTSQPDEPQNRGFQGVGGEEGPEILEQPKQKPKGIKGQSNEKLIQLSGVKGYAEPAKQQLKQNQEDAKLAERKEGNERRERIEIHKQTAKADEEIMHQAKTAKAQESAINDIENAVKSGKVKPSSLASIFKGMGPFGDKVSQALLNKDEATLLASIPQLLEGWKQVFGVRLSDADLALLEDKLPSIFKNPEANLAVTKVLRKYSEMAKLRGKIATDIKKENKGFRSINYLDQIEEKFDSMTAPVRIISPRSGKEIEIPAYKLSEAMESGAKLAPQNQGQAQ